MPDNPYPKWRRDRCKWCEAGVEMSSVWPKCHRIQGDSMRNCTSPTEAEYIAELEARIGVLSLTTRQHSDEAWRKRVERLEAEISRLRFRAGPNGGDQQ